MKRCRLQCALTSLRRLRYACRLLSRLHKGGVVARIDLSGRRQGLKAQRHLTEARTCARLPSRLRAPTLCALLSSAGVSVPFTPVPAPAAVAKLPLDAVPQMEATRTSHVPSMLPATDVCEWSCTSTVQLGAACAGCMSPVASLLARHVLSSVARAVA